MQLLGNVPDGIIGYSVFKTTFHNSGVCTWLDLPPQWKAIFVTNWFDIEKRCRVARVRWPAVQLDFTTAAPCVHNHSIVVHLKTCGCACAHMGGGRKGVHMY